MSVVTKRRDGVRVRVTLDIEPEPTTVGYSKGPKVAVGLSIEWNWRDGAWGRGSSKVFYHRVKNDGTPYADRQDGYLYPSDPDFADLIESTRPTWEPSNDLS